MTVHCWLALTEQVDLLGFFVGFVLLIISYILIVRAYKLGMVSEICL